MDQATIEPNMLDSQISDICEKINQLLKRENDIKSNAHTDVDIVEKDNLLRRIRVERRDLNRQLADLSVQSHSLRIMSEEWMMTQTNRTKK